MFGLPAVPGILAGQAADREGKFNQAVANANALSAERDGAADVDRVRYAMRQQIGQQLTAQGGSGMDTGTGSAMDAIAESQVNGVIDAMNVRRKAQTQADALRLSGSYARMEGHDRAIGDYYGAAAAVVKSAEDYAKMAA